MSKAERLGAGAIPTKRATVRRSVSKARKSAKLNNPRNQTLSRGIGTIKTGGGDVACMDIYKSQPKAAEMLRVLATAYTKF